MATAMISTPMKSHAGIFSTKTAGGRMPLTPSPRTNTRSIHAAPSQELRTPPPCTPTPKREQRRTASYMSRSVSYTNLDSPKSNIALARQSPRRLELGISQWSLTGSGASAHTPSAERRQKRDNVLRSTKKNKAVINISAQTGDRFIPDRTASEAIVCKGTIKLDLDRPKTSNGTAQPILQGGSSAFDLGSTSMLDRATDVLNALSLEEDDNPVDLPIPESSSYHNSIASACGVSLNTRILAYKPAAPESSKPIDLRSNYNRPLKPSSASSAQFRRRVLSAPDRVLDAPGLMDDYYLNLLDWSSGNQVAIGLERNVYVWSADAGTVSCLLETSPDTYVSSVKWSGDGAYVGVGLGSGEIQIWDVEEGTKLRSMYGHESRVGVMGWNKHTLSTGARSGLVFNHDVRIAQHKTAELVNHTSEVCGLEWRPDGAQLATGGNDNLVTIWDARSFEAPKFSKTNHKAAVKALSWCPWQLNLLSTGGGSYDRNIHFWNTTTGARVNSIDTGSQVTSLRWSTHYKEIVSSSGFPDNSLSIWSYPTLIRNVEIPAHETRVLHSCLSPDGQMLATAAADESLKFWKLFEKKPGQASLVPGPGVVSKEGGLSKTVTIR